MGGGEGGSGGSGPGGMEGKVQELAREGGQDWMLQEEDTEDAMFELASDAVREMRGIDFALLATFHRAMLVKTVWLGAGLGRASEDGAGNAGNAGNAGGMRYGRDTTSREEGGGRFLITIDNGEGEHTLVDTDFIDPSRSRSAGCQMARFGDHEHGPYRSLSVYMLDKPPAPASKKTTMEQKLDESIPLNAPLLLSGYNQVYVILNSRNLTQGQGGREVYLECGKWCYGGFLEIAGMTQASDKVRRKRRA